MLFVGAHVGGVSYPTLPPCSSVLVCPCLACLPLNLPSTVYFLRASSSEPKQQFHLFCQCWECTQTSLVVSLPALLDAKPEDFTHMPALPFLSLSFTVCMSFLECQSLSQWWRVLRRDHLCVVDIEPFIWCAFTEWLSLQWKYGQKLFGSD